MALPINIPFDGDGYASYYCCTVLQVDTYFEALGQMNAANVKSNQDNFELRDMELHCS